MKAYSRRNRPSTQGTLCEPMDTERTRESESRDDNQEIIKEFNEGQVDIKTMDAEYTLEGRVLVAVTGHLTAKNGVSRSFSHTFFLATQDHGYYILNGIFRYIENDGDELLIDEVVRVSESIAQNLQVSSEPKKLNRFCCPICMHQIAKVFSTTCGHVFCERCIKVSIQMHKECPLCKRKLELDNFHRVYLPAFEDSLCCLN